MDGESHHGTARQASRRGEGQPRAVWVTAFAAVIAFMGIGLVDPILKSIGEGLDATPEQVTLLFSSYIFVQVFAMLVTGVFSARFGAKRTVLTRHIANWAGNDQAPFLVAVALVAVGAGLLLLGHRTLGTLHVVPAMAPALANAD